MASVRGRRATSQREGSVAAPWPLVARERELAELVAWMHEGRGCYVVGDAGVGKTRLVTEAARRAAETGITSLRVSATESAASVPLSPFLALLPPDLTPETADRLQLFRTVTDELTARSQDRPTIVIVDDAHLLAGAGAALLLHLALNGIPIVAVVRADAPLPDAVTALWKDGVMPRVDLGPLDAVAVGALLAAALEGAVERTTVTRLHEATGGNPLFLRELVLAGRRDGALAVTDGLWRVVGNLPVGRPLRELVRRRIDHLDPDVRLTLELLAVAEEWPLESLDDEQRRAVKTLEAEALVRIDRDGRRTAVRVAHPILGETIRVDLGAVATQAALRQLIGMLRGAGMRRRDDRLRLAVWQLEVGGEVEPDTLVDASRRALQLMDPDLAARLAAAAGEQVGGVDATVALAAAEIERNRFDAAERELGACEDDALAGPDATAYALRRGWALGIGLGRIDDALAFLSRARPRVPPAEEPRIDALRAALLATAYRLDDAAALAYQVTAHPHAGPSVRMTATAPEVMVLSAAGLVEQAIARATAGMALVAEHGDERPRDRIWVLGTFVTALLYAGRYDEVEATIRPVYDAAVASHDEFTRGAAANVLGMVALDSGHPARARRWMQEATSPLTRSDPWGLLAPTLARLALAEALTGHPKAARRAARRATAAVRGQLLWHVLALRQAEVWTLAAEDDVEGARALAVSHADGVQVAERVFLMYDAIRLGETDPAVLRAVIDLTDRFEGARFAAINAHVRGLASSDAAAVWDAVDPLARHNSLLAAADAAAVASRLFDAAGEARLAVAARNRALGLVKEGRAAAPPAVAALTPTPLTKREQQVVALARKGRSNQEIADALTVSRRTVESHLSRAYAKLGVTGRDELRDLED